MEEDKQRKEDGNSSIFWSNLSPTYCNLLKIKVGCLAEEPELWLLSLGLS